MNSVTSHTRSIAVPIVALLFAMLTLTATGLRTARADGGAPPKAPVNGASANARTHDDEPWKKGVSEAAKKRAKKLFERAMERHEQYDYEQALDDYKNALKLWDHPGVHHNIGLLYINLSQPKAAYEHFTRALSWGPNALKKKQRIEAEAHIEKLLRERLGRVIIRSEQPGIQVSLNGHVVFTGPGKSSHVVEPGSLIISAVKPDHYPVIETLTQLPGQESAVAITLSEDRVDSHRRFPTWLPWTVLSSGLGVSLIGGVLQWRAHANVDEAEAALVRDCVNTECNPRWPPGYERARLQQSVAIGALTFGGLAAAAGLLGAWFNRPVTRRTKNRSDARFDSKPLIWKRGAGWSASVRF